ncbi:hypothetical protein [Micromonospora pisi]|uniref:hypothetical protein n=1 Tax=Micromonospora pisi TaxID=589240 RepID=UPI000EADBF3F|nr:hypothetical protein [Micromonospora pisi]
MNLFQDSRYEYLYPPTGEGIYCVGNAAECDHLTYDGTAVRIPWAGAPGPDELSRIRSLQLLPTVAQLARGSLPTFLPRLPAVRSVSMPSGLLPRLDVGNAPPGLAMLMVVDKADAPAPRTKIELDAVLPDLRGLMFLAPAAKPNLMDFVDPLPSALEFLHLEANGRLATLEQLRALERLRHLELVRVRAFDVFDHIRSPLRVLEIGGARQGFPIERLATVASLRSVRLNGVYTEIDCAIFRDLPELVELDVLNCNRVGNVEALLDCPKLTSVRLLNCKRPFDTRTRAMFRDRGFARLDIDFA